MTRWKLVLSVCLLALAASVAHAQDAGIQWRSSYKIACEEAERTSRPLMVEIGDHGCIPCAKMDQITFIDPRIIKLINERFIPFKFKYSADTRLAIQLNVQKVPTCILCASDGKTVINTGVGFQTPNEMHELLQQTLVKAAPIQALQEKFATAKRWKNAGEFTRAVSSLREIIQDGKAPVISKNAQDLLTVIEKHAEERLNIATEMHGKGNLADAIELYANVWRTFPNLDAGHDARERRYQLLAVLDKRANDRLTLAKEVHANGPLDDSLDLFADVWRTFPYLAAGRESRDLLNLLAQRNQKARDLMKHDFIPCIVQNQALWGLWPYGPVQKSEPAGVLFSTEEFAPRPQPTTELKVFDYERTEGIRRTKMLLATYNLNERFMAARRAQAEETYIPAVAHLRFILADGTSPAISSSARELLTSIEKQAAQRLARAKQVHAAGRVADAADLYAAVWRTFANLDAGCDARDRLNLLAQRDTKARELMKDEFMPHIVRNDSVFGLWPYGPAPKSEPLGMFATKGEFAPKLAPLIAMKVFDLDKVGRPTANPLTKASSATALVQSRSAASVADTTKPTAAPTTGSPTIVYMAPVQAPTTRNSMPRYGPHFRDIPSYTPSTSWNPYYR